jgi:ribonuclease P protein component
VQRRFRLTSSDDFKRVRRFGKSYAHPLIVLVAKRNDLGSLRIAVSAGRSVGNAVQRNRAKRLIREAARPFIPEIDQAWDIVLLARQPLARADLHQVREALTQLLRRANLLGKPDEYRS